MTQWFDHVEYNSYIFTYSFIFFLHILTYSYIFSNIKQDNLTESHHRLFGAQLMNFPATGAEGHHMVAYCGYGKKKKSQLAPVGNYQVYLCNIVTGWWLGKKPSEK